MNPTSAPVSGVYPQAACGTAQGQNSAQGSLLPLLRQVTPGQSHTAPWREAHSRLGVLGRKEVTGMYCWPNRLSLSKRVMIPVVTQDKTSFTKIRHWRLFPSPLSSSFSKNHTPPFLCYHNDTPRTSKQCSCHAKTVGMLSYNRVSCWVMNSVEK